MSLELLLADADDGQPVLRQGLPMEALQEIWLPNSLDDCQLVLRQRLPMVASQGASLHVPTRMPLDSVNSEGMRSRFLAPPPAPSIAFHVDPNELPEQHWGLVIPEGAEGDRLLALIDPLRRARQETMGGRPVHIYRVPFSGKLDGPRAARWKKHVFRNDTVSAIAQPRYLLLLGDLDQIPLEVQQVLSIDSFVGRLAFPTDDGYEAYAAKVLRWERSQTIESRARLLFYTSRDGTSATEHGYHRLVAPTVAECQRNQAGQFPEVEIHELGGGGAASIEQLLAHAAEPGPSVLFSLSHGQRALKDRRARQGALVLPGGQTLTATEVAAGPFLPGGVWFCFACFSAGTPAKSSYAHWLRKLQVSDPDVAGAIASALLRDGEKPFISALPQAVLANPEGPLAVIGHVDLAWSYSFNDQGRRTSSRYLGVLRALADGSRAGIALGALLRGLNETSFELAMLYDDLRNRQSLWSEGIELGAEDVMDTEPEDWAELWMLHKDLANFILLGDPAVSLPLNGPLPLVHAVPRPAVIEKSASTPRSLGAPKWAVPDGADVASQPFLPEDDVETEQGA